MYKLVKWLSCISEMNATFVTTIPKLKKKKKERVEGREMMINWEVKKENRKEGGEKGEFQPYL